VGEQQQQQPQQQQQQHTTARRCKEAVQKCRVQNGEKRVLRQNYDKVLNLRESAGFRRKVLNLKESAEFKGKCRI
jgi:hypothetical protein